MVRRMLLGRLRHGQVQLALGVAAHQPQVVADRPLEDRHAGAEIVRIQRVAVPAPRRECPYRYLKTYR
jgi:hypothetical protein